MEQVKSGEVATEVQAEVQTNAVRFMGLRAVWRRLAGSPRTVAGFTLFLYTSLTLVAFHVGVAATDFAVVAAKFAHQSTVSTAISFGPTFHYIGGGYDGQFSYFIALDPKNARFYLDTPAYRYERILYPLVARVLALGQPSLIPYTLILVNILAISGGVLLLAYWLRRRSVSPWLALIYGLFSGLFVAYQRDLTEPLGYGLAILAIYVFDFSRRHRTLWAGVCFGLAALAREATLVFAALYILARLLELHGIHPDGSAHISIYRERIKRNWRPAALMGALAVGPFLAYKVFLTLWLGTSGAPSFLLPSLIPFSGLIAMLPLRADTVVPLLIACVPGLGCFALSLWAILQRRASVEIWALFANALLFVVMLRPIWYEEPSPATTRIATGIVLAALLSVPTLTRLAQRNHRWLAASTRAWLAISTLAWLAYPCFYIATRAAGVLAHL